MTDTEPPIAYDGVSTISAAIKQAVADGHCACEHLNSSTKVLSGRHPSALKATAVATMTDRVSTS